MRCAIHAFGEDERPARGLADALGAPFRSIDLHRFPDGESLPSVAECSGPVALYRSLDRPDSKFIPLLLAADALRRRGADRVVLVAPYLCYLRQDVVFHPGEPLSRDVVGRLLGDAFDAIVTVQPHLHRTLDLQGVFGGKPTVALSAAEPLAAAISPILPGAMVVGPDAESDPWAVELARLISADTLTLEKLRRGDREVDLAPVEAPAIAGRRVVIVDDVCSSGGTLEAVARRLRELGAVSIEAAVAHALFDGASEARLRAAGVRRIVSTDSCPHPTNAAPLAALLAQALKDLP